MSTASQNGRDYVPFRKQEGSIGVPESPIFPKDASDRNRTSPFAFTGNKFEFRMLGSQANVADANIVLNTIIAKTFSEFADKLEGEADTEGAARKLITETIKAHSRIIFNLDGYGPAWEPEAERRGLLNNKDTADATEVFFERKNIDVFVSQGVYTEEEALARAMVRLENYVKIINIEAVTMLKMAKQDIIPAVSDYVAELCSNVAAKKGYIGEYPLRNGKEPDNQAFFAQRSVLQRGGKARIRSGRHRQGGRAPRCQGDGPRGPSPDGCRKEDRRRNGNAHRRGLLALSFVYPTYSTA